MTWRVELGRARAIAWKDLTSERRSKAGINSVTFLGVLVLLLFGFALGPDGAALRAAAAGAVWLGILFSGVLAFNRSYQLELESGAFDTLLLYPGSRWSIYVGKLIANLAFVLVVEVIMIFCALVLFQVTPGAAWPQLLEVTLLGTVGFVALGTFYSAMSSRSRSREVMLPLLLFPMMIPVLLAAVSATTSLLTGDVMGDADVWIRVLIVFDVVFLTAALLTFEYIVEV